MLNPSLSHLQWNTQLFQGGTGLIFRIMITKKSARSGFWCVCVWQMQFWYFHGHRCRHSREKELPSLVVLYSMAVIDINK